MQVAAPLVLWRRVECWHRCGWQNGWRHVCVQPLAPVATDNFLLYLWQGLVGSFVVSSFAGEAAAVRACAAKVSNCVAVPAWLRRWRRAAFHPAAFRLPLKCLELFFSVDGMFFWHAGCCTLGTVEARGALSGGKGAGGRMGGITSVCSPWLL
jgi:hypothetical protein